MKRLLSWLLALVMIISCLPMSAIPAFAEETEIGVGDIQNPDFEGPIDKLDPVVIEEFARTETDAVQIAGDAEGNFYIYTAPADGEVTLNIQAMYDDEGKVIEHVFDIIVENQTTKETLTLLKDGKDNYGLELVVPVKAGQELLINTIWVKDAAGVEYPAGKYTWVGNFTYPAGSEQNPIEIIWEWNEEGTIATATVEVPEGGAYYDISTVGMGLTVEGQEHPVDEAGKFYLQAGSYDLVKYTPVGADMNPEVIELPYEDINSVAENKAYYYTWTAVEAGKLTLTISDNAVINVLDEAYNSWSTIEYVYGEQTTYTTTNSLVIDVVADQVLEIAVKGLPDMLNRIDKAAENYKLTATFEPAIVKTSKDGVFGETYTAAANEILTITYNVTADGTITIAGDCTASVNDTTVSGTYEVKTGDKLTVVVSTGSSATITFEKAVVEEPECTYDHSKVKNGTTCPTCGKAKLYAASMDLSSSLGISFFVLGSHVKDAGCYAEIYVNGELTDPIPKAQWDDGGTGGSVYLITYSGLAAKQMSDEIVIVVKNGDHEEITIKWVDSARDYVMRNIDGNSWNDKLKSLAVAMLNYGAAAQDFFNYNEGDPANKLLTEDHQKLAPESTTPTNIATTASGYYGASLNLETKIELCLIFFPNTAGNVANISYTDHNGESVSYAIELGDQKTALAYIDTMAVADVNTVINVTVKNAAGNDVFTIQESVGSYLARMLSSSTLYQPIYDFGCAAYNYFHG